MAPFVIFALPRSRTAWLSRFLTFGDWQCGHEELRHCRSLADVTAWLDQPCSGTVETAAAPFWRWLVTHRPDARIVTVRRPVPEVVASLLALNLGFEPAPLTRLIQRLDAKLDQIERRVADVMSVPFGDLADETTCARIFEYCLPYRHDPAWWAAAAPVNVQISMPLLIRHYTAFAAPLAKLALTAKHCIVAGMTHCGELEGVIFRCEPFDDFYRDATPLFAEHLVQTGQAPDAYLQKNVPMLQTLDRLGALQCLTARSNGRMFGYLMSVIGPSLDDAGVTQAIHTIFFASPDIRGLGMKLQRAALDALRARGVGEVLMRAGHRGSGPRLGTFYRRLGAEPFGDLYRLDLKGD